MDFSENTIDEYLEELSTKAPVPGGGGVSALTGALAAGLSQMVCSLTVGKKKYADVEKQIIETDKRLLDIRERLVKCMEEDALAFEPLSKAYGLPRATEDEIRTRQEVLARCLKAAALPPLHICELISELTPFIELVAEKGSTLAVSDAGCAAALAACAVKAAALNVFVNTGLMEDRSEAESINKETHSMLAETVERLENVYKKVSGRLEN